jgi:hypothetical protein
MACISRGKVEAFHRQSQSKAKDCGEQILDKGECQRPPARSDKAGDKDHLHCPQHGAADGQQIPCVEICELPPASIQIPRRSSARRARSRDAAAGRARSRVMKGTNTT